MVLPTRSPGPPTSLDLGCSLFLLPSSAGAQWRWAAISRLVSGLSGLGSPAQYGSVGVGHDTKQRLLFFANMLGFAMPP